MTEPIDRWGFPIRDPRLLKLLSTPPKPAVIPRTVGAQKLLEGLRKLCAEAPGKKHSHQRIADECDTSEAHIRLIERAALRKLRARHPHLISELQHSSN